MWYLYVLAVFGGLFLGLLIGTALAAVKVASIEQALTDLQDRAFIRNAKGHFQRVGRDD